MEYKTWFIVAFALLAVVTADPAGKEPQKEAVSNTESRPQPQKHKRQDNNYEMQDMIVYLTPTQIKAIESGKAVLEPQYSYTDPSNQNEYLQQGFNDKSPEQQKDQIQNSLHQEGQEIQRQIENLESNRKARLQLQETQPGNDLKQKATTYLQGWSQPQPYPEFQQSELQTIQKLQDDLRQEQYQQIQQQPQLPQLQSVEHYEQHVSGYSQRLPNNYANEYSYPKGQPLSSDNLHLFFPKAQQPKLNEQVLTQHLQQEANKERASPPKLNLIPYEYSPQAQLEAQTLLQNQWAALSTHHLEAHRAQAQENESQQLKEVHQQLNTAQIIAAQHQDETQQLQAVAHQLEADQYDAIRKHSEKVLALQSKAVQQIKDLQKEIKQQDQLLKVQQKEQDEAQRLDEELEKEEFKAEVAKAEEKFLQSLRNQESEKNQYLTMLAPLLQHEQIKDAFKPEKNNLWNYPKLEGGFKPLEQSYKSQSKPDREQPLQYAPSYNEDKFSKVLKASLQKNQYEKAKAFAKAEAISREQPVIVHQEVKVTRPIQVVKHVNIPVPQPFYVPVPSPFEVKVPQPYPVPLEIIRHVPVPIVKTEKIEVEKPVPVEVEKRVPVPVTKNVYIPVDKPYIVERIVPVEVKKEVPVEKVIHRPQKYTIVKHVWKH